MNIQIISDVHAEYQVDSGREFVDVLEPEGIDVLAVAGDLCGFRKLQKTLEWLSDAYAEVVYTFGNHECYGATIQRVRGEAQAAAQRISNLHFLDNSTCTIDGQRFVGTALWFPYHPENVMYESGMDDFRKIRDLRATVYNESDLATEFLRETVRVGDVVMTHHLPSYACVSERFKTSSLNRFFVNDMDDLIFDQKPKLWIHGHTHDSKDFMHGDTRIVCNPFGVVGHGLNPEFVDQKVIEI